MKSNNPCKILTAFIVCCISRGDVSAFRPCLPSSYQRIQEHHKKQPTWIANAKSSKKKKRGGRGGGGGGGGFGTVEKKKGPNASTKTRIQGKDDDFAAFPPLEESVKETLIAAPATSAAAEAQDLSSEIYQRVGEIYGFRHFNYLTEEKEIESPSPSSVMSLEDLMAAPAPSTPSGASNSDLADLFTTSGGPSRDIADLLETATGGNVESSTKTEKQETISGLPIDNLPAFEKFRVLHVDPLVISIDDFLTADECDRYVKMSENPSGQNKWDDDSDGDGARDAAPLESRSPTVGKDALAKAQRTSTTWFHHFKTTPELVAKASRLLGLDTITGFEEPQTVRYRRSEKFTWHLDALAPSEELKASGGQRLATLLVYLTDLAENEGGATMFRDLGGDSDPLKVVPQKGMALLFFPAAGGVAGVPFDIRTLHSGEAVAEDSSQDKWIAQLWLREGNYRPTAPPGNSHADATRAISQYCAQF